MVATDKPTSVVVQASSSNKGIVPDSAVELPKETLDQHRERKGPQGPKTGVMIINPTEKCSLKSLLKGVEAQGFVLNGVFYQERIDRKDPHGKRTYHMVRFVFVRQEDAEFSDELDAKRDIYRADFQKMCDDAMWRVRAFSNPFFENGEEVPSQRALSINLEARVPLFRPDGEPVAVWQKDENGKRVGDAPVPIGPDGCLVVEDDVLRIVKA